MKGWLLLVPALCALNMGAGCNKGVSGQAYEDLAVVGSEMRRYERIRLGSPPSEAQLILGREPEAIQHEAGVEVHLYRLTGGVRGEVIRLVYKNRELIQKDVVPGAQ
jgi:hypothetical protein